MSSNIIEEILTRGVEEVIDKEQLKIALMSKKSLRIKLGIDPTSPNIHIGRAVVLWKLRALQELGHKVVFIVGDFTGQIGDTSDKDSERPMLSDEQIKNNIKTYFKQAGKIIDAKKAEMHYNSRWLKKLGFLEIGKIADLFGLHEFEARENISRRLKSGKRVSLRELLYPLMQGYDSVAVKADVELGGTDQRFNLLAGRVIQPYYGQKPQNILMTTLMEGTDGRKMSSSWGNVINITDSSKDMFGKVMSVGDGLIKKYFVLATRVSLDKVEEILSLNKNPRDQKLLLAQEITSLYYGPKVAESEKEAFIKQFTKGELPEEIEKRKITGKLLPAGQYKLSKLLKETGLVSSTGESRRLIDQKGVKVNNVVSGDVDLVIDGKQEYLLQVGKRRFLKIV
ncbi:MAG: tyrosine--tRNA ligase [Candidatus Doudnabacteria bacterium]|nr:tyrosine--tRNA ligase [Candidatus Doudnabacteria bacterium]